MTPMKRRPADSPSDGTRTRVLALLRESAWTVDDLAERLGVTDNAVRFHLDALERDGVARKEGLRRTGGGGPPAALYSLPPPREEGFSRAHAPVLFASMAGGLGARSPSPLF